MKLFLFLICITFAFMSNAQTDTVKPITSKPLKKGFYRNYKEFLDNNPTKFCEFKYDSIYTDDSDYVFIGIQFRLNDTVLFIKHVWGYCDGKDIFVNHSVMNTISTYWKLEGNGHYPFYYRKEKDIGTGTRMLNVLGPLGRLTSSTIQAATDKSMILTIINEKGKSQKETMFDIKEQLEVDSALQQSFNDELDSINMKIKKNPKKYSDELIELVKVQLIEDYLIKLNELEKQNK